MIRKRGILKFLDDFFFFEKKVKEKKGEGIWSMVNLVFGFFIFLYFFLYINDVNFLKEINDFWFLFISWYIDIK